VSDSPAILLSDAGREPAKVGGTLPRGNGLRFWKIAKNKCSSSWTLLIGALSGLAIVAFILVDGAICGKALPSRRSGLAKTLCSSDGSLGMGYLAVFSRTSCPW